MTKKQRIAEHKRIDRKYKALLAMIADDSPYAVYAKFGVLEMWRAEKVAIDFSAGKR